MDKEKKMSNYRKKTNLAQFTDVRRQIGGKKGQEARKKNTINDGLTPTKRRYKKIKKAANGCWWVEQYIIGSTTYHKDLQGVDDE
jgi:hypothetical protein